MTANVGSAGSVAAGYGFPIVVTVGQDGVSANFKGFSNGGFGSASPASIFSNTITQLTSFAGTTDFSFILNGTGHAQSLFRFLVVELNTANTFRMYTSAAATFNDSGAFCNWSYGAGGASPVWTTAAIVRRVIFYR
jgi:hypothetical protein